MRIPESKIEEIRVSSDIVDIISEFVPLRKRGKNFIGLCPFHTEKTPSFTVNEEKQIYHCFGCHSGGNVFKFLMEYEKISFIEAVEELAGKSGITLEYDNLQSSEMQSETEILYEINTLAARFFSDNLLKEDEGETARNYFAERKIKPPSIRAFGLGYSPRSRDALVNYLSSRKADLEKALTLGLIFKSNEGRLYDRFYGRIIFPIFSPNGRVVAFAGRILEGSGTAAKYVNSPESQVYYKSRILYGLSFAKDEIRKLNKAILVEGYMDLISLYQAGIKNVVAVSGTALTEDQVTLLSRYTKNVYLLFDSDTAGIKASMRSIEILLKKDFEIKIVTLPAGEDPDSFINNYGKVRFEEEIDKAENFLEYQTGVYQQQGMFNDAAKTAEAIRELVKPIALIGDELKRNLLVKSIASKFNLREKLIESELDKILQKNKRGVQHSAGERSAVKTVDPNVKRVNLVLYNVEKEIIKLLFESHKRVIELILQYISDDELLIPVHLEIKNKIEEVFNNGGDTSAASLLSRFTDQKTLDYLIKITFEEHSISKNWVDFDSSETEKNLIRYAIDTIKNFKLLKLDEMIHSQHQNLEKAVEEDEKIESLRIIGELNEQKKKIAEEMNQGIIR